MYCISNIKLIVFLIFRVKIQEVYVEIHVTLEHFVLISTLQNLQLCYGKFVVKRSEAKKKTTIQTALSATV